MLPLGWLDFPRGRGTLSLHQPASNNRVSKVVLLLLLPNQSSGRASRKTYSEEVESWPETGQSAGGFLTHGDKFDLCHQRARSCKVPCLSFLSALSFPSRLVYRVQQPAATRRREPRARPGEDSLDCPSPRAGRWRQRGLQAAGWPLGQIVASRASERRRERKGAM